MQTRLQSLIEAKLNLFVGFGISWAANVWVVPWLFGIEMNAKQGFGLVVFFSILSLIRQYILRRWFNRWNR